MAVNPSQYPYQLRREDHNDPPGLEPGGGFIKAWDKASMMGATIEAAVEVLTQDPGVYVLEDVIEQRVACRWDTRAGEEEEING